MNLSIAICVFYPIIAAPICLLLKKHERLQNLFILLSCLSILCISITSPLMNNNAMAEYQVLSFSFCLGGFQIVYSTITSFMWFCAALLSPQYFKGHSNPSRYYFFFMLTLGATQGIFLSADLMTTFTFFEVMSFASYLWVINDRTDEAFSAGKTYLTIAVVSGMVCLMGLFMLNSITSTLKLTELYSAIKSAGNSTELYAASFCLLVGFGAKAGLFPFHIWLPKAHPVAPAPASALLSGVLTKTGLFGLLVVTSQILRSDVIWGYTVLVLACITMLLGAVLAVFSTNIKRTLACSSLSQIGFISVGISMIALTGNENLIAANSTMLYMVNHSIVKLTLFLCAGAIYSGAHTLDLNRLRGYGRGKPILAIPFLIGACSLGGIPGFCGYLSKTLVHESVVEYTALSATIGTIVEWLFLISGGLTVAYMLKLFITIFVEKRTYKTPQYNKPSFLSSVALIISSAPLLILGAIPKLSDKLMSNMVSFVSSNPFTEKIHYFSISNLKGSFISITIGVAVYFLIIKTLLAKKSNGSYVFFNPWKEKFSLEHLVYIPVCKFLTAIMYAVCSILDKFFDYSTKAFMWVLTVLSRGLNDITDFLILLLRKTVFKSSVKANLPDNRRYAYALGNIADKFSHDNSHTKARLYSRIAETISKTTDKIVGNFSFALLMTCFGICAVLVFIILSLL